MINNHRMLLAVAAVSIVNALAIAQTASEGVNKVDIRGKQQIVYFYPGSGKGPHTKVLFAPGDAGLHGFAIDISKQLASLGYDVFAVDTRIYLESFTGATVLTTKNIAADFRQLANWMAQGKTESIVMVGWSEGAGLGIATLADPANHAIFSGMLSIGTTEYNILGWRWRDLGAEVMKTLPSEPTFKSIDLISQISPRPLAMITSVHDEYVSGDVVNRIYMAAKEPKRLITVDAEDHKFRGNTDAFFKAVSEALVWVLQQHNRAANNRSSN